MAAKKVGGSKTAGKKKKRKTRGKKKEKFNFNACNVYFK